MTERKTNKKKRVISKIMSIVDKICHENGKCPLDMVGEFSKSNSDFLDRMVFVYDRIFWDMIEQKFPEEFTEFANKLTEERHNPPKAP